MRKILLWAALTVTIITSLFSVGHAANPTGSSYMLYEQYGGTWCDAEKRPPDDGPGNPGGDPGGRDDLLCWAATASNVLEWTGWGYISGMWSTDEMFQHYQDCYEDLAGGVAGAWIWWFNGLDPAGGNFWPGYDVYDYFHEELDLTKVMEAIDNYLHAGFGVGISIVDGAHAITVWGFNYDPNIDKATDPYGYYLGIWVTDSDDSKGTAPPAPNVLKYRTVTWDAINSRWNYGDGGWYITRVRALAPFPSQRPITDAGGPYVGYEGSAVTFDGSGSSDPDGDALNFRWDFEGDDDWDTVWSSSASSSNTWDDDHTGTVVLQVYAYQLSDVDTASVTIINVAPTVNAGPDQTVNEGDVVSFSGSFTDPGILDTHTISWDFGDGTTATGTLTPTHVYGDNEAYTATLTVTDDDGGVGTDALTVTVKNVAPTASIDAVDQPNEQFILPVVHELTFPGSFTDPGTADTHTAVWDWGDGSSTSGTVTETDGSGAVSGSHVYSTPGAYTVTLTVTDDDGGSDAATYQVTVVTAEEAKEDIIQYIQGLPNTAFKGSPTQRKNAFSNMFRAIDDMLDHQEYKGAVKDLLNNVRSKADGQFGGDPRNDWIVDPAAQGAILEKIDDLTAYLETLL